MFELMSRLAKVDILDIIGIDVLGVDILGIDITAPTQEQAYWR